MRSISYAKKETKNDTNNDQYVPPNETNTEQKRHKISHPLRDYYLELADGGELDIYMVASIVGNPWSHVRSIVCVLIQVFVAPLALIVLINEDPKGPCEKIGHWTSKVVGIILCLYLFVWNVSEFFELLREENKFFSHFFRQQKMAKFSNYWYIAGFYINTFCLLMSSVTAVFLIYNSPDPVDIVINAVALVFVFEMDDWLVSASDFQEVKEIIEELDGEPSKYGEKTVPFWLMWPPLIIISIFVVVSFMIILFSPIWIGYCY